MKTILQKRSKFIAGLFHTLAIITCVSLTSCEKKEQPNEKRNALLADLKKIGFLENESLKIIDYCFKRGIDDITTWAKDKPNLKKIFNNEASKILSRIQHQNGNEDNVKTRRINEWKIKLQNFQEFKELVPDKQNQVIDLFIKGNVNINFPDDRLKTKLKEFVEQIDDDDKNVLLVTFTTGKAEVNGKIFDLNTFDGFKDFSHAVNGKKINKTGNFSYDFADKKVKICGGNEISLSVESNFNTFLDALNILAGIDELNVKGFSLQVESDGVALNTIKCSDDYYKGDFWNYVKDHSALFGLSSNELPIEKGGNDNAWVKIKGKLITTLKWNDVVKVENTATEELKKEIIKDEWGKIFKLKEKVTVSFRDDGSYKLVDTDKANAINAVSAIGLNDLNALEKLVQDLDCKELKVNAVDKLKVSFVTDGKVKIGNNPNDFPAVDKKNFEKFLRVLDALKQCISAFDPKITLTVDTVVKIGDQKFNNNFVKSESFWKSIKNHVDLFTLGTNKLEITNESKKVKIGNFQTELYITTVCENCNDEPVVLKDDWKKIFKKKLVL